jgi:hypothetical protein
MLTSATDNKNYDEITRFSQEYLRLNKKYQEESDLIRAAAEERLFNAYHGNIEDIVSMIKTETPNMIAIQKILSGNEPNERERNKAKKNTEDRRQQLEKALDYDENELKKRPDDQELIKAIEGLKDTLKTGDYEDIPLYDRLYNEKTITENMKTTFSRYLSYLQQHAPETYAEMWDYIVSCIKNRDAITAQVGKKPLRTSGRAGDVITDFPNKSVVPSLPGYEYATGLYQNGNAYLQPLTSTDGLRFQDGKMFFEEANVAGLKVGLKSISEAELQNMKTKEGIESLDLPLLRCFYSIILNEFEKTGYKTLKEVVRIYAPDLAAFLGDKRNMGKPVIYATIDNAKKFHNIIGIIKDPAFPNRIPSMYPVLNFEGYDEKNNTISFSSPYMNHIIKEIYRVSIVKDKNGLPALNKKKEPKHEPAHNYLVKSSIAKERNKNAVENVYIITNTILQAGKATPHIAASLIVERNPQLKQAYRASANPRQLLKRVFTKTLELLYTQTTLLDDYVEMEIPSPANPANIPTPSTLGSVVYSFPNKGKTKKG